MKSLRRVAESLGFGPKSPLMHLHEDGRVEMLSKPWVLSASEFHVRGDERYMAALAGYVRAWPDYGSFSGYSDSVIYWRKPLGYLVPFVGWARDQYWKLMVNLAWAGFLDSDLDGGILSWRDFTLKIVAVQKRRYKRDVERFNKRLERVERG